MSVRTIGIVGGGTIGASWAAFYLARGFEVVVTDPSPEVEDSARRYVAGAWPALEQLGMVMAGATPDRLHFERDLRSALAGVDFVQENGPEREALKIELFARMDEVLPAEVIIASSSSGLLMSRVQSGCRHPERCVTGHPFNPPHLIPLVEVVGGERTSAETIERAVNFYRDVGKRPIRLRKEVPGHVANRLQAALWREAIHLVAEGVASVADVDAAVTYGPGLRWPIFGPHMTFHLGGGPGGMEHFLAHLLGPFESFWEDLGHPRMTPELQRKVVDGVREEAGDLSPEILSEIRDRRLIAVLRALEAAR
ncbi:3-hydroxyacyl-CoA dehydrogenase NAD-binding domain-containing protein [Roseomonas xinghualingensis]|uniref:3-hydroxyacyl-CoA dehydrogenase NAD-binding domain-containing protein n=1 Tax=Roseomonas xinghualingensis TaxID=2986475 RepID=UPI0021F17FC7|nr:3-hydroxyacyl-CoA dehydrogenase NAD-binding domain-containing protein [Roseomonas sp. SXEYE001]MCV4209619.1 3-hydroxyacyl-CoA dehydrogenase NAD-binding domain-containing protein [Roseomonas sp. SXEYE001]